MSYAFVQDIEGGDWETYQQIVKEAGDQRPAGLVIHVAGPTEGGVRLIDVWESEEACQRFMAERLEPARARVLASRGFTPMEPRIEVLDVQHEWR